MDKNHATYKDHPVYQKLIASGPKRILSLVGLGNQEVLTLEYLEEIEKMLSARFNDPQLVLSDYFDLVGGSNNEAIIATFIALGKPINEIKKIYLELRSSEKELSDIPDLINLTVGSEKFKTGLAIFMKRTDSLSTVVIHNHPTNKNYDYNNGIYLLDLLNAPSSRIINFDPNEINFNDRVSAIFIANEESVPYNLLQLMFLMTTNKDYGFHWRKSKDHLLMISLGKEIEKDDTIKQVSSKHFPRTFDFGVTKPTPQPISQEEIKKIFTPILKVSGCLYKKSKCVFAKKADSNIDITTITSDGLETKNTAYKGDFIVKNQTDSAEQYVIKEDKFEKRYDVKRIMPDGIWTEYSPKGQVTGVQLTKDLLEKLKLEKHFNLIASWGQPQYVAISDFIVNPINEDGFYRIGVKEFKETYTLK